MREAAIAAQGLAKAAEIAGYTLPLGSHQRAVPRTRQAGRRTEGLLRSALRYRQARLGHRVSGTLSGSVQGRGNSQPSTSPKLAVSHQISEDFAKRLLKTGIWHLLAWLGPKAPSKPSAGVVKAILLTSKPQEQLGIPAELFIQITSSCNDVWLGRIGLPHRRGKGCDACRPPPSPASPRTGNCRIRMLGLSVGGNNGNESSLLGRVTEGLAGIQTGDYSRFGRRFWEIPSIGASWTCQHATVKQTMRFWWAHEHPPLGGRRWFADPIR